MFIKHYIKCEIQSGKKREFKRLYLGNCSRSSENGKSRMPDCLWVTVQIFASIQWPISQNPQSTDLSNWHLVPVTDMDTRKLESCSSANRPATRLGTGDSAELSLDMLYKTYVRLSNWIDPSYVNLNAAYDRWSLTLRWEGSSA